MNLETLLALSAFAFVSSITPGPNNLMLMASGANFGIRRTLPHLSGVCLGFTLMIVLVGVGLMQVFDAYPVSYTVLKYVSVAYLLFLAWKIATAAAVDTNQSSNAKPLTFIQAVLFQWVNPKAWTMALTSISVYAQSHSLMAVLKVALVFGLINLPCIVTWAFTGQQLKRWLNSAVRLRTFNIVMALLLVSSLYPALFA